MIGVGGLGPQPPFPPGSGPSPGSLIASSAICFSATSGRTSTLESSMTILRGGSPKFYPWQGCWSIWLLWRAERH